MNAGNRSARSAAALPELGPEQVIQSGINPVELRRVKLSDLGVERRNERIRFTSATLLRWSRRTQSLDTLFPILYPRGVLTGNLQQELVALLGQDVSLCC
jgi:putative transposase